MKTAVPIVPVAIRDRFGQSAQRHEDLLAEYGLTPEAIAKAAKKILALK